MKVKILIEFEVPGTDDPRVAKSAASMAAYDYLELGGRYNSVEVSVDGYEQPFLVELGEDHE